MAFIYVAKCLLWVECSSWHPICLGRWSFWIWFPFSCQVVVQMLESQFYPTTYSLQIHINYNIITDLYHILCNINCLLSCLYIRRSPWCNGYHPRKWTWRHEFKSWPRLIAFHIAQIPLGKVWSQLFFLQLWVNSRAD